MNNSRDNFNLMGKKKKVKFDNNIKYNTFQQEKINSSVDELSNVDNILSTIDSRDSDNSEKQWYSDIEQPLVSHDEMKKYGKELIKEHEDYNKSLGKYLSYMTNDDVIIKTDFVYKSPKRDQKRGLTIAEYYDHLTKNPDSILKN